MNAPNDPDNGNAYVSPPELAGWKNGFTITRFVVVAVFGILLFMLLPPSQRTSGGHRRTQCLNQIRQVALAMINYENENRHFLPAYIADENGKPMHSWRVLLLPYLNQDELYQRYSMDEPWDGPNKSKLHDEIAHLYRCPKSDSRAHGSVYALITGEGTAFDGDKTINYQDLSDGYANTILMVEIFDPDFHWMKPQDIPIEQFLESTAQQTANHSGNRNIATFGGATYSISTDTPKQALRKLVEIADGEVVDVLDFSGR